MADSAARGRLHPSEELRAVTARFWDAFRRGNRGARLILYSARARRSYLSIAHREGSYLVFGSETEGLPTALIAAHRDATYRIPIFSEHVRSHNLANAAAIAVYEALRQLQRLPMD